MKKSLRIMVVVAHPDEAEEYVAGTIARLAEAGHHVKIVSMTNGDAGHREMRRKPLALRRATEAYEAGRILNVADYEILGHHDGELVVDNRTRRQIVRRIRRWQADIVMTFHDECDGHLDNRRAGRAVREAVELLALPNVCAETPALYQAPLCLRMVDYGCVDHHRHDIVVDIDASIEQKLRACAAHSSQFLEFSLAGGDVQAPARDDWNAVRAFLLEHWGEYMYASPEMRSALVEAYGAEYGASVTYAESFELAGYGRQVTKDEARNMLLGAIG